MGSILPHHPALTALRDVSVDIPKRRLAVLTGVSGSGKSSLVVLHQCALIEITSTVVSS